MQSIFLLTAGKLGLFCIIDKSGLPPGWLKSLITEKPKLPGYIVLYKESQWTPTCILEHHNWKEGTNL